MKLGEEDLKSTFAFCLDSHRFEEAGLREKEEEEKQLTMPEISAVVIEFSWKEVCLDELQGEENGGEGSYHHLVVALVCMRWSRAKPGEIQARLLGCLLSSPCVPVTPSSGGRSGPKNLAERKREKVAEREREKGERESPWWLPAEFVKPLHELERLVEEPDASAIRADREYPKQNEIEKEKKK
ncbi:hypothetical protein AAES_01156 [Amazona aestiva]|uniref:Uncharacterized protein n=1 Tax=Amazona aestiva TaxID=12930 RepID=A0A0Q3U4Q5_AMAAE|nr:hypothetical protein AAES_01156 [Amazona aestiva]